MVFSQSIDRSPRAVYCGGWFRLAWAGASAVGKVRSINEDSFLAVAGMWLVADGMGGHRAGEVASGFVAEAFAKATGSPPCSPDLILSTVETVNEKVWALASTEDHAFLGTTVVGIALVDNGGDEALLAFNVGDSRCYLLPEDGPFTQVTTDHSVVQELVDAGELTSEEARHHPERNVITRAVGIAPSVAIDFAILNLETGRLLLCSDGLTGDLTNAQIEEILRRGGDPAETSGRLVEAVLEGRAADNVTAIVLDVFAEVDRIGDDSETVEITGPRPTPSDRDAGAHDGDGTGVERFHQPDQTGEIIDGVPT